MIHESDVNRVRGDMMIQEKRIMGAMNTCKNSTNDWAKNFWFNVFSELCKKYNRMDLYNKFIH